MTQKISLGLFLATLAFFVISVLCFLIPGLQNSSLFDLAETFGLMSSFGLILMIFLESLRGTIASAAVSRAPNNKVSNIRPA